MFSIQVVLSKTSHVNNTIGKSINLLKCVFQASLSFIDPFNNSIIKLMGYVLKKLICLTPVAMRRRYVYWYLGVTLPYWNLITVNNKIIYLKKNASRFSISPVKWTSKPESRQCNEKADNLRPKSGEMAGLRWFDTILLAETFQKHQRRRIMLTYPCNADPLTHTFIYSK